jgi:hypothetical protein
MNTPTIKALTKRIRLRMGSTENAASAANVSPGVWSGYENADKPETTIPIGRLVGMALTSDERREIARWFADEDAAPAVDLNTEASETIESAAELGKMVRLAAVDGVVTEAEARTIRAKALETIAQAGDVLKAVS